MIKINQTKIFETYQEFIKYENQFKNVPDIALTLKLLKHEELENINEEKLLSIKTSAWLSSQTKDTFILAHIPTSFKETQKYRIIKYPDNMGRQIDINDNYEYFVNDEKKVFYLENSPNSLANILDQKYIIQH